MRKRLQFPHRAAAANSTPAPSLTAGCIPSPSKPPPALAVCRLRGNRRRHPQEFPGPVPRGPGVCRNERQVCVPESNRVEVVSQCLDLACGDDPPRSLAVRHDRPRRLHWTTPDSNRVTAPRRARTMRLARSQVWSEPRVPERVKMRKTPSPARQQASPRCAAAAPRSCGYSGGTLKRAGCRGGRRSHPTPPGAATSRPRPTPPPRQRGVLPRGDSAPRNARRA